ncbi:MAG: aminotransferase class IV [Bacteroidales bacterium]|jgi:branched-subunit amino acid aminotransferase/4-amino-4-deoxychorismate lyase
MLTGFNNGQFIETDKISVPIDNLGINRGYGAFDFFGVINRKPFYIERHLDRFMHTIELLRLEISYKHDEIKALIENTIHRNQASDFYIKLFALPLYPDSAGSLKSGLYILPVTAISYDEELYSKGAKLITKNYTRFLPEAKSTNYLPMVFWYAELMEQHAVDVLYLTDHFVRETSRGNIFMVKNEIVYTPGKDILKGITKSIVMDILNKWPLKLIENEISINDLLNAEEIFISSTTKKIMPVVEIDSKKIGDGRVGQITKKIMTEFEHIQKNFTKSNKD